ncbi:unnamed protein product [Plutella xylostella]|uniref:Medium-chain acyl-CoA ligase ACSF2, mitochondrial n=1 Tax=Plutella xylostella TaxID=51655 RepID=A0A8S4EE92_PLUXY|nr:unnamed protein product [Plutella xylostella]
MADDELLAAINFGNGFPPSRYASTGSYLHNPGSAPLQYETLGRVLRAAADRSPGRRALRSRREGVTMTYEELLDQADALGCGLRARGLGRGDRLGVWSHNCAAWPLALVAAARVGLIPVAINPVYEKGELSFCLKKTGVKALLIGDRLPSRDYHRQLCELVPELPAAAPGALRAPDFPELRLVVTAGKEALPGTITCDSLIKDYEKSSKNAVTAYGAEISPDDGCIIHFTSGTTGEPKAALDTHFGIVNNSYYIGRRNTLHEGDHTVCVQVPIFHALGSVITVVSALHHGAALVLAGPTYSVSANADALYGDKCSVVIGTPTMFVDLVSAARKRGTPHRVGVALTAGAPCSPQLFMDIQKHLNVESVKSIYGMTETTGSVFQSLPGETMERVTDTVGYLQDHVEVKVVDDDGRVVPFGSPGELLVRGYNTMACYWDEPAKTREALGDDGWLRTGDYFTLDADGYGRVVGRKKDIIVRGGENVAPKEIEDLLNAHPDILESQVIGVADARLGEELCAVVRLRDGACVTLADVTRHVTGRLARHKVPRLLRTVEEFPKTASGKILKYKLREMVEQGLL